MKMMSNKPRRRIPAIARSGTMGILYAAALCALALLKGAQISEAQPAFFDPRDYGKAELSVFESTGNASKYIAGQKGAFEPVHELPEYDPIRQRARAIGRIDLLLQGANGSRSMHTCTGTVMPKGWVLTNHHCIPARSKKKLIAASILMDYLTVDGGGSRRYKLSTRPQDWHSELDFSLVRALQVPDSRYGTITFSGAKVRAREALLVIHHPLGRPKVMTRFRCFATQNQPHRSILRHRCDTMPGSSGALLFNRQLEAVVLHHSGGMVPNDDRSYNKGTRIEAILSASKSLSDLALNGAPRPPANSQQPKPGDSRPAATVTNQKGNEASRVDAVNRLLRGN